MTTALHITINTLEQQVFSYLEPIENDVTMTIINVPEFAGSGCLNSQFPRGVRCIRFHSFKIPCRRTENICSHGPAGGTRQWRTDS